MGQGLCGSATTTEATRRAIRHSQESLRALSKFEAGVLQGRDQGVEDIGDGAGDAMVFGEWPAIWLVREGPLAVELTHGRARAQDHRRVSPAWAQAATGEGLPPLFDDPDL